MENNVAMIQKQIKAFNKYMSRAESSINISSTASAVIQELIGSERATASGRAKAGTKYLESLTPEQLMEYSGAIQTAKETIIAEKLNDSFFSELDSVADPKSQLWRMYDHMMDLGYQLDSDQVKSMVDGDKDVHPAEVIAQMQRVLYDENYGISDMTQWYNGLNDLDGDVFI